VVSGVPVAVIRRYAWERGRVSYDGTNRRLNELIEQGLAIKPKRGYYLPINTLPDGSKRES
jgi:hypothetical protein